MSDTFQREETCKNCGIDFLSICPVDMRRSTDIWTCGYCAPCTIEHLRDHENSDYQAKTDSYRQLVGTKWNCKNCPAYAKCMTFGLREAGNF